MNNKIGDLQNTKRVAFHTLGCRLNFAETGTIAAGFAERGYEAVAFGEPADVTFINTCTVTDAADSTCRNTIRKARRFSPKGTIIVAGCYAQIDGKRIASMEEVDLVLGTSEKFNVFRYLEDKPNKTPRTDQTHDFHAAISGYAGGRTRAFLKIQDGCSYKCSFCIIPQARGSSRTISTAQAISQMHSLVASGFKEVVLTGVNIGEYGRGTADDLPSLVASLLKVKGLERLRLSSVEPNTITKELLNVLGSSEKFMPYFHVPLQSGNDEILKRMRRRYRSKLYRNTIERIALKFPKAAIGADIICGFPGEGERQFLDTFRIAQELPLTHFHVFPYSRRKGTPSASMGNHPPSTVKKNRVKKLTTLGVTKLASFARQAVSQKSRVLFEKKDGRGYWWGYSPNFLKVCVEDGGDLKNRILEVQYLDAKNGQLKGSLLPYKNTSL